MDTVELAEIIATDYDGLYRQLEDTRSCDLLEHHPEVAEAMAHTTPGRGLDIGCGRGGNTLLLARARFNMKAVDLSESAINLLLAMAVMEDLKIEAIADNIFCELLPCDHSIIVCTYFFGHMGEERDHWLINRMKEKTKVGGVNVITTFDLYPERPHRKMYRFTQAQFLEMYTGWKIISCSMEPFETSTETKPLNVIRLIAKKLEE